MVSSLSQITRIAARMMRSTRTAGGLGIGSVRMDLADQQLAELRASWKDFRVSILPRGVQLRSEVAGGAAMSRRSTTDLRLTVTPSAERGDSRSPLYTIECRQAGGETWAVYRQFDDVRLRRWSQPTRVCVADSNLFLVCTFAVSLIARRYLGCISAHRTQTRKETVRTAVPVQKLQVRRNARYCVGTAAFLCRGQPQGHEKGSQPANLVNQNPGRSHDCC